MSTVKSVAITAIAVGVMTLVRPAVAGGDAERGRKEFRVCVACHSIEKGAHRTGPSLAAIWGRKAGTVEGFRRYSKALKGSGTVWNEDTLDKWLKDPRAFIPGNRMIFRGLNDAAKRADLIAFLKGISGDASKTAGRAQVGPMGQRVPDLKELGPNNQVKAITYCADTYDVTTATGETHQFWEYNLRLKTDSSRNGPAPGTPMIIPGGMRGDRAFVVFTSPEEISAFIKRRC